MTKAEREKLRERYETVRGSSIATTVFALLDHIDALEQRLFDCGEFVNAPCFLCGYNGPGYHQESQHSCVADIRRPINAALASAPEVKP
jgi:hypothetical protein